MVNDYLNGIIVGIAQTLIGHPFDTLKILRQTKNNIGKAKLPPIPATPAPLKQQNTSLEESTQNGSKKVRNSITDDDEEKV